MIRNQWLIILFTAFLLCVMPCSFTVHAEEEDDEIICEDTECDEIFDEESGIFISADGSSENVQLEFSIDSEYIGAELTALNNGSITLNASDEDGSSSEIFGAAAGIYIEATSGGKVTANTAGIESEGPGIQIDAEAGTTVSIDNQGYLDGYNAFYADNNGGTVTLTTQDVQGVVGIAVLSGGGTTTVTTGQITVEEYGVAVDVEKDEAADGEAPKVTVTVNGDITDDSADIPIPDSGYDTPDEPEVPGDDTVSKAAETDDGDPYSEDWWTDAEESDGEVPGSEEDSGDKYDDLPEDGEVPDPGEDVWNLDWDDDSPDDSDSADSVNSTGVTVSADGEGSEVTVTVNGKINTAYGNEIQSFGGASVTVNVSGDVETDYGNRISAEDPESTADFDFGGNINAGGVAVNTYAESGELTVKVAGDIVAKDGDDSDFETAGIYSDSEGSGKTTVDVTKGIKVSSNENNQTSYGIDTGNIGGEIEITVGENIEVKGSEAVGISIINDPDSGAYGDEIELEDEDGGDDSSDQEDAEGSAPITTVNVNGNVTASANKGSTGAVSWNSEGKTNISVYGDITGSTYGIDVNAFGEDKNTSFTDILVTGTISGKKASFLVNEEADNDGTEDDNLNLTVWKIDLSGSKNAAQSEDGKANDTVAKNIKYIVKIADDSVDKVQAVGSNGDLLTSHDFPYALEGERIYLESLDGSELSAAYNGKDSQTALKKDETGRFYLDIPKGGAVWLSVNQGTAPEPVNPPNIVDLTWLSDRTLPATGFSASHVTEVPAVRLGMSYKTTGLTLQIPALEIAEPIRIVPETDGEYFVEGLGSEIGMLEQSSLPGKGISVLTGHNHLNTTESGPFLLIGDLEAGDRMMISDKNGSMLSWRVYGNYKIPADGFSSLMDEVCENALVLITCEDESVNGGYLNRRVILAEPVTGVN